MLWKFPGSTSAADKQRVQARAQRAKVATDSDAELAEAIDQFGGVDRRERKMIGRFLVRLLFSQNFVSPCEYFPWTCQVEDPSFWWTQQPNFDRPTRYGNKRGIPAFVFSHNASLENRHSSHSTVFGRNREVFGLPDFSKSNSL